MGVIPFLPLYYLANLGSKTVISFVAIEIALYITFFALILPFGLLPAPANFSGIAWANIPVVSLIILVVLTRHLARPKSYGTNHDSNHEQNEPAEKSSIVRAFSYCGANVNEKKQQDFLRREK